MNNHTQHHTQRTFWSRSSIFVAVALLLWIPAALITYGTFHLRNFGICTGDSGCGGLTLLFLVIFPSIGITLLLSELAGLITLVLAARTHQWVALVCLGIVMAVGLVATYALWFNGVPGHPVLTAIYSFPPSTFGCHSFAVVGSVLLILMTPVHAVAIKLTSGRVQQALALAGLLVMGTLFLAIRMQPPTCAGYCCS